MSAPAAKPLEPQAALETAVRDLIRSQLSYREADCDRMFDDEPPPRCGKVFASVWSDGNRTSDMMTCLNEVLGVNVTVTVRFVQPADRWVKHRDDLEARCNAIRALIHADQYDFRVLRLANQLAGFDSFVGRSSAAAVGFREALMFERFDPVRKVGPDWFKAELDAPSVEVGAAQTIRFGKARRVQALVTER
ncbi:MAG: hypothetical protein KGL39_07940 [Patescibacteria group bacterium]|nr:hypothetical protein [Patescibacteria group bacterium]